MASLRQIRANQLNAMNSTGPTTDEGKAISRRNALKHGLAGAGIVLPEDEAAVVAGRVASWVGSIRPADDYESWLVEQIALESVRVERCQQHERTLRELTASRAELCWDEDRQLAAEELGDRLAKRPALIACQLRGSRAGAEWLAARWEALGRILESEGLWTDGQRSLALDLLGTPADLRVGPTPIDVEPDALRSLVAGEVARLARLRSEALDALDEQERTAAELGLDFAIGRELATARRYERGCARRLEWALAQLKAARSSAPAPASVAESTPPPTRIPVPAPAPTTALPAARGSGFARPIDPPAVGNRQARRAREAAGRRS